MGKKRFKGKICYLCGQSETENREHMPPKSFFTKATRIDEQLITVPAHEACNNAFSTDDEHFRNLLVLASGAPSGYELFSEKVLRAVQKNPKAVVNAMIPDQPLPTFGFRVELADQFMLRLLKAIYYHKYERPLALDLMVKTKMMPDSSEPDYLTQLLINSGIPHSQISQESIGEECSYVFINFDQDGQRCVIFGAHFYRKLAFTASAFTEEGWKVVDKQVK